MEVNVPLLRKAVEWAEAEALKPPPKSAWHQGNWKARPSLHARMLAESRCIAPGYGLDIAQWHRESMKLEPECGTSYCIGGYVTEVLAGIEFDDWYAEDGRHIAEIAAEMLGIDPPECLSRPEEGHLFCAGNTIEDIRRIAENLAGERL